MFYKEFVQNIINLGGIVSDDIASNENLIESICRRNFAERLKQARIKKGYTQKQLADNLEMAMMTISQYETQKRETSISSLAKIAKNLSVSTDWLLGLN